jgi:hypothetical protein
MTTWAPFSNGTTASGGEDSRDLWLLGRADLLNPTDTDIEIDRQRRNRTLTQALVIALLHLVLGNFVRNVPFGRS